MLLVLGWGLVGRHFVPIFVVGGQVGLVDEGVGELILQLLGLILNLVIPVKYYLLLPI